jgi:hypothetical protein
MLLLLDQKRACQQSAGLLLSFRSGAYVFVRTGNGILRALRRHALGLIGRNNMSPSSE